MNTLTIGLLINPLAGLGGSVALKGSDGMADQALRLGATPKAQQRVEQALMCLLPLKDQIRFLCPAGLMGETLLASMGFSYDIINHETDHEVVNNEEQNEDRDSRYKALGGTTAADTVFAAQGLQSTNIDLLLFAGGDGTARDICSVVGDSIPVLGIPAGVKIHSAVYAINPQAAGALLMKMLSGELMSVRTADVRDIDEVAFREGVVKARLYGEMLVPEEARFVQMMKCGGIEKEEWVISDIAAEIVETMEDDTLYIVGSGSTTQAVMDHLGLENTLLGVDLVKNHQLIASDVTESLLESHLDSEGTAKLIISVIGGQGHIFGRGNQQLSSSLIRRIGKANIQVIASKAKLKSLDGRPMLIDTGDALLDEHLSGWYRVITGYQDEVVYPATDGQTTIDG
jgi:predicted polyphosphate/ATP-dependent NAD kinase